MKTSARNEQPSRFLHLSGSVKVHFSVKTTCNVGTRAANRKAFHPLTRNPRFQLADDAALPPFRFLFCRVVIFFRERVKDHGARNQAPSTFSFSFLFFFPFSNSNRSFAKSKNGIVSSLFTGLVSSSKGERSRYDVKLELQNKE